MAPALVETTTETESVSTYKLNFGQYKEIDGHDIDTEVETGQAGGNGAKVNSSRLLVCTDESRL